MKRTLKHPAQPQTAPVRFISFRMVICLLLLLSTFAEAQIFGTQYREQFRYAAALSYPSDNNYRVLALTAKVGFYPRSVVFVYNQQFEFADSIPLLNGVLADRNEPIKESDRLLWPVVFWDTINSPGASPSILELDTFYQHKQLHKLGGALSSLQAINLVRLGKHYFAGFDKSFSSSVIYKLNSAFQKTDSIEFSRSVTALSVFNGELLVSVMGNSLYPCAGKSAGRLKKLMLDTLLNETSCYSFDSVDVFNVPAFLPQDIGVYANTLMTSKVIALTKTKTIAAGYTSLNYKLFVPYTYAIVNVVQDVNNQITGLAVRGNSVSNTNYFDFSNYIATKGSDVLTVASVGNDFSFPSMMQPQPTKILITKQDTSGNLLASREYGGDMFYRPNSVVFTEDGGCLVAGYRFDTLTMKDPSVFESFLLKVSKEDLTTGQQNIVASRKLSVFPNPCSDRLNFAVDFDGNATVDVISSTGVKVFSALISKSASFINISELDAGLYIYKIAHGGQMQTGRFLKIGD